MTPPLTNAYIRFEGLQVYVTKILLFVDGEARSVLARSNTRNPRRQTNLYPNPRMRSTGQYRRLDDAMAIAARSHGIHGVSVQAVCNRFLPEVLLRYGYRKLDEKSGLGNFYKAMEDVPEVFRTVDKRGISSDPMMRFRPNR